ncbi:MAG: heme-binding protein [Burkholderiales bacterium]
MKLRNALAAALAVTLGASIAPTFAQDKKTVLNIETARKMAAACVAKAKAEGWRMNIAILDDGANLKYFERMDGSFLGSVQIAQLKANTSASFPFPSKLLGEIAQRIPGIAFVPGLVTFEGGVPVKTASGEHIGSIGVSGASAEQDGQCAQAALDAVKDDLK